MTPEQFVAILTALTALVGAVSALWLRVERTHRLVDGKMDALLRAAAEAAEKRGELEGRDYERQSRARAPGRRGRGAR